MADEKIGLEAALSSTADTSGADKMADALDKTKKSAEGAGEAAQKAGVDYTKLGEVLAGFVATAGIIDFLNDSIKAFYEDEKAIRAVTAAATVWGANQEEWREKTSKFTEALSKLSGVADDELTAAIGKVATATGDLGEGMRRTNLAVDIVAGGGAKTFAEAFKMVEQATNGAGKEIRNLVPEVAKAQDRAEFAAIAVHGLEQRFRGANAALNDHAKQADIATAKWQLFQKEIGSYVLPAVNWVRDALQDVVLFIEKWAQKAGIWFDDLGQHLTIFGKTIDLVLHGKFKESNDYVSRELAALAKRTADNFAAIDKDFVDKKAKNVAELLKIVKAGADGEVTVNKDLKEKKIKSLDETQHYMLKQYYDGLAAQEKAYKKHTDWMIKETHRLNAEILKDEKHRWKEAEEVMRASTHEMAKRYAAFAKLKYDLEASVATGTLELAGEAFGMQKEMAIASATINAASAFISALAAPYPMDIILPVLVAAEAALQIANIVQQDAPSVGAISSSSMQTLTSGGFDDPMNDQAAYLGGRKWANDMIGNFTAGVSQGWASGLGASSGPTYNQTFDNSRRTTINAGIMDPNDIEHVKKLVRKINMVDSNTLGQTRIAQRTR